MSYSVVEQDRKILESQRGLISRLSEHLSQAEVGVIHPGKLLNQEFHRQEQIYNRPLKTRQKQDRTPKRSRKN